MLKGIDISHYAGKVDFNILKDNPDVNFVIIKFGQTIDSSPYFELDSNFLEYYKECKKYKIPIGLYVYTYTNYIRNMELAMAKMFEYIYNYNIDLELPIYLDLEANELKGESKETLYELIQTFCNPIEENGFWAGIYSNLDWYRNVLDGENLKNRYTYWLAHYGNFNENKYYNQFDLWQNRENQKIRGIEGFCDTNIMYRNLIDEIHNNSQIQESYFPPCTLNQDSLVDALKEIGIDSSFSNRKEIARINRYRKISRYL